MQRPSVSQSSPSIAERFRAGLFAQREQADARVFWLLVTQWGMILVTSFVMARRWDHARLDSLSAAVVWVGVLSVLPLAMVLRSPGSWMSRWTVVVSQGLMSSLLWYISGGRPDTHLHLFAWLVVLALYRDVPLLVAGGATALVGHALVLSGSTLPALTFDDPTLWFTHLVWMGWLAGEIAFLVAFVLLDRQSLSAQAERDEALDTLQAGFQSKVDEVTRKIVQERDLLKLQVAAMNERRSSIESARSEASQELLSLRTSVAGQATEILKLASRPVDRHLTREWRSHWESLRRQTQRLMRLVDLPSVGSGDHDSQTSSEVAPAAGQLETQKRAMLLMRNPLHQAKAVTALETEGYKVDVVPNGPRTYYSAMLNDYSLIVVDIDLPGDEGFDTLEALRLLPPDEHRRQKCLFAVTTELTPDRVLRCTNLEVDGMFLKPLKAESLHEALTGEQAATDQVRSDEVSWSNY